MLSKNCRNSKALKSLPIVKPINGSPLGNAILFLNTPKKSNLNLSNHSTFHSQFSGLTFCSQIVSDRKRPFQNKEMLSKKCRMISHIPKYQSLKPKFINEYILNFYTIPGGIMARINIEDSLYRDGRFQDLAIQLGSRHAALGAIVEAFALAQEFFLNEETGRLIPLIEWKRRKAVDLIIEVGLAEVRNDNFVYVCGSEKQFAWLLQRASAGKKGGRPKSNVCDIKKPDESGRLSEQTGSNPLTLTLTHSLTPNNTTIPSLVKTKSGQPLLKILDFENEESLFAQIPISTKDRWLALYHPEYVKRETLKAWNYYSINPRKRPKNLKGWIQALSYWFDRGWANYVKTIEPEKSNSTDSWLEKKKRELANDA